MDSCFNLIRSHQHSSTPRLLVPTKRNQVMTKCDTCGMWLKRHSRLQSPRSFWSAPGIETSGRDRSRKSANHGLPAFVRSLRNLNNNGYYRLQKWAAIALARYLVPARGLDPWRRPKGSWALGTRRAKKTKSHKSRTCVLWVACSL